MHGISVSRCRVKTVSTLQWEPAPGYPALGAAVSGCCSVRGTPLRSFGRLFPDVPVFKPRLDTADGQFAQGLGFTYSDGSIATGYGPTPASMG